MCGLAGLLSPQPETGLAHRVHAMTDAIAHRGPDSDGYWTDDGIALGHRRLSILDLSPAGAQPMHDASSRYVMVFNGEIYNHLDLRAALAAQGIAPQWRGHSDTETLLAAISHWGLDETLQRAGGMFALALWDRQTKRLSLARDRMGEKPLYWGWAGSTLVFGSELKALRQHPDCPTEICREALAQYLRFAYVPAPRSIHPGLYKLEPGCILEVDETPPTAPPNTPLRPGATYGTLSIRRYWSLTTMLAEGQNALRVDEPAALADLETTLSEAVKRQMLSDVPLGAFLSGGIDSSLIAALMQKNAQRPVRTFTVGFETAAFNEAPFAAAVAQHLGTDHTELTVTEQDARDVIPDLPALYDEPFGDSSQIPTHLVCRAARAHVTVALSGDAGDELFGGYNRYFWAPRLWSKLSRIPHPARRGLGAMISAVPVSAWDRLGGFAPGRVAVSHPGDKAHKLAAQLQGARSLDDLYRGLVSDWPGHRLVPGLDQEPPSVLDDPLPAEFEANPVARMMVQDMRSYLPDDIMCKVDRAAMGVSLETRVPFLDPEVLRLSAQLPLDMKLRDGQGKWALREILYRHVPRALIERPKTGFGIPVGDWLRGPLKPWAEELLSPEALAKDDLLDPTPIRKAWADHQSKRRDWTQRLWIVLMFQAWRAAQA